MALGHGIRHPSPRLIFQVDSLLVANQLASRWRCRSAPLRGSYEQALAMLAELRSLQSVLSVCVRHVYREYNADADGICNAVLLLRDAGRAPDERGWYATLHWEPFLAPVAAGNGAMISR